MISFNEKTLKNKIAVKSYFYENNYIFDEKDIMNNKKNTIEGYKFFFIKKTLSKAMEITLKDGDDVDDIINSIVKKTKEQLQVL